MRDGEEKVAEAMNSHGGIRERKKNGGAGLRSPCLGIVEQFI